MSVRPSTDVNSGVYDREAEVYLQAELLPAERTLLRLLKEEWSRIEMLDLGVGAGRTAYTFAAITKRYVGLDYSRRALELARRRLGDDASTRFVHGDARDLSRFADHEFDLVMFSFNGIDSVGHDDRLRILSEVRRVTRHGGRFFFSAHSLPGLPSLGRVRRPSLDRPLRSTARSLKSLRTVARLRAHNRWLDLRSVEQRRWALIRDPAHDFSLVLYWVLPAEQLEQLRDTGWNVEAVYDTRGLETDPLRPGQDLWLHYLCRPA